MSLRLDLKIRLLQASLQTWSRLSTNLSHGATAVWAASCCDNSMYVYVSKDIDTTAMARSDPRRCRLAEDVHAKRRLS